MRLNKTRLFLIGILITGACSTKRAACPAYRENGAFSIPEEGFKPDAMGYFQVEKSKKTGLAVGLKKVNSRKKKSALMQTDEDFLYDPLMYTGKKNGRKGRKVIKPDTH